MFSASNFLANTATCIYRILANFFFFFFLKRDGFEFKAYFGFNTFFKLHQREFAIGSLTLWLDP